MAAVGDHRYYGSRPCDSGDRYKVGHPDRVKCLRPQPRYHYTFLGLLFGLRRYMPTVCSRPIFSHAVGLAEVAPRTERRASHSYFRAFSQGESIVDVYAEVAYRVLYFAVPQ